MGINILSDYMSRDEALEILVNVEEILNGSIIPNLKDVLKKIKGEKVLAGNVLFSSLNLKTDDMFFKRVLKVCTDYSKIIPALKSKIDEELPDKFNVNTSNINIRIALSLVAVGTFLACNLNDIIMFIIARFYIRDKIDIDKVIVDMIGKKLIILIQKLPELEKADFEALVDIIGKVPVINTIRDEDTSVIPTDVVTGFITKTFKIKNIFTLSFIKQALGLKSDKTVTAKNIQMDFIYNPIYHIRLFLVDLEELRLERLKDSKRLLELRLLELKNRANTENDPKLKEAITYYENKLEKLDRKIERYLKG